METPSSESLPQPDRPHDSDKEYPGSFSLDATTAFVQDDAQQRSLLSDSQTERLVEVLDEYLTQLKRGKAPDRQALLDAHPDLAKRLTECLAGLDFIHTANHKSDRQTPVSIGDFRIIREVGHGGMGAVYEAEQISLRRRVALKILRFSGLSDPDAIKRFQREAETVARLHHTHIVPIFAVGCDEGINYYAMQFIDGQSLDQVLRRTSSQGVQLPYDTIVQWGLQAAEALCHAHARGVIHRDIKPSNLMIDAAENRIWLTDFGLAKNLDDVTLSLTGALLGTPRYMSPEQASASQQHVDHRTDIYSLGATLYELATGQPIITGETPHDVISQILTTDPVPPRKHRPEFPRDLETILMKCVAKDAAQRYTSAEQLASDLRAFLEGRPILARRAGLVERAKKWAKRQQRNVVLAASAVAITLLLVASSIAIGYAWKRSRLAFFMLKSDSSPLVAQWIDDSKRVALATTVPTQNHLELPAGNYQLRLSGHDRLSQSYDVMVKPGEHREHKLSLDDQLLWENVEVDRSHHLVRFDSKPQAASGVTSDLTSTQRILKPSTSSSRSDVLCLTHDGLKCLHGRTGEPRWNLDLRGAESAALREETKLIWPWDQFATSVYGYGVEVFDDTPMIVSQSDVPDSRFIDFNQDGHTDLLLALRNQASLLAIDGETGTLLWNSCPIDSANTAAPSTRRVQPRLGGVVYRPIVVADQDGDGVDDLLALFITMKDENSLPQRSLELISGASGHSVWTYKFASEDFALQSGESVPYALQWFYGQGGGYSSGGGGSTINDVYYQREHPMLERSGMHHYVPTNPIVSHSNSKQPNSGRDESDLLQPVLTIVAGRRLMQLDLRTGTTIDDPANNDTSTDDAWSKLDVRPHIQPLAADFDGDGENDLLLVEAVQINSAPSTYQHSTHVDLAAWSIANGKWLWKRRVNAHLPRQPYPHLPAPNWPLIVDLDGDGAAEVLTPSDSSAMSGNQGSPPWGKISLLDGRTGQPKWQRQLFTIDQRLEHLISGPDINHDGIKEVFVASVWAVASEPDGESLFIDCLSGADGETIWRTQQSLSDLEPSDFSLWVGRLHWYHDGSDGRPQLIVSMRHSDTTALDRAYIFSAAEGLLAHVAKGTASVEPRDLDADGTEDLILFKSTSSRSLTQGGILNAVRGVGCEAWRRLGDSPLAAVGDLDGDGIGDLVTHRSAKSFDAFSGATGHVLWQSELTPPAIVEFQASSAQQQETRNGLLSVDCDLSGDGTSDLLLVAQRGNTHTRRPLLIALSGSTGNVLWQSQAQGQVITQVAALDCRDLNQDGNREIVVVAALDHDKPRRQSFNSNDARLWLIVASGQTGETQWAVPLTYETSHGTGPSYRYENASLEVRYVDFNDDGLLDIILPAQIASHSLASEMRVLSGKDGQTLWQTPLPIDSNPSESLVNVLPVVVDDLDDDKSSQWILSSLVDSRSNGSYIGKQLQMEAFDGVSGVSKWKWATDASDQSSPSIRYGTNPIAGAHAIVVRRRGGKHWIATGHWNKNHEVHVINELGEVVSKRESSELASKEQNRFWAIDVNGDGDDELLISELDKLKLLDPEKLDRPIWQLEMESGSFLQILKVVDPQSLGERSTISEQPLAPQVVVLQTGNERRSVHGIDGGSGKVLWICIGPAFKQVASAADSVALLNLPMDHAPPHVMFQYLTQSWVRCGVRITTEGNDSLGHDLRESDPKSPTGEVSPRSAVAVLVSELDPRLCRELPWKPSNYEIERMPQFVVWAAFYGVTLALVPAVGIIALVTHRRWTLRWMFVWAPAVLVMMLGFWVDGPHRDFQSLSRKLIVAYFSAGPVLLTIVLVARWLMTGRFREAQQWLGVAAAATIIMTAIAFYGMYVRDSSGFQPGEHYRWDGLYWLAVPVFYLAAWAFTLGMLFRSVAQLAIRFVRWFTDTGIHSRPGY